MNKPYLLNNTYIYYNFETGRIRCRIKGDKKSRSINLKPGEYMQPVDPRLDITEATHYVSGGKVVPRPVVQGEFADISINKGDAIDIGELPEGAKISLNGVIIGDINNAELDAGVHMVLIECWPYQDIMFFIRVQ